MNTKRSGSSTERCIREMERNNRLFQRLLHLLVLFYLSYCSIVSVGGKNKWIHGERWEQDREEKRRLTFEGIMGFVLKQSKKAIWQTDSGKLTILLWDARIVERSDLEEKQRITELLLWMGSLQSLSLTGEDHTHLSGNTVMLCAQVFEHTKDYVFLKLPTPNSFLLHKQTNVFYSPHDSWPSDLFNI